MPDPTASAPASASPSAADSPKPSASPSPAPSAADAIVAIARLEAISVDLRGCAILDRDGSVLAASGDAAVWEAAARGLLAAADAAAGKAITHAHVGTEDGEAFAVRHGGYAIVAASDRFTLASLLFCDLRAVLRDLIRGPAGAIAPPGNGAGPAEAAG